MNLMNECLPQRSLRDEFEEELEEELQRWKYGVRKCRGNKQ